MHWQQRSHLFLKKLSSMVNLINVVSDLMFLNLEKKNYLYHKCTFFSESVCDSSTYLFENSYNKICPYYTCKAIRSPNLKHEIHTQKTAKLFLYVMETTVCYGIWKFVTAPSQTRTVLRDTNCSYFVSTFEHQQTLSFVMTRPH